MTVSVFRAKAPKIMRLLMQDFPFDKYDAAAVMGNAGHESGGLTNFQEDNPWSGQGGFGWFQWTGPRRRDFMDYCRRNTLNPRSDDANYKFLWVELNGSERRAVGAVKSAKGLYNKTVAFERAFERAGIKHYSSRYVWAKRALAAYEAEGVPPSPPIPSPAEPEGVVNKPSPVPDMPVPKLEKPKGKDVAGEVIIGGTLTVTGGSFVDELWNVIPWTELVVGVAVACAVYTAYRYRKSIVAFIEDKIDPVDTVARLKGWVESWF